MFLCCVLCCVHFVDDGGIKSVGLKSVKVHMTELMFQYQSLVNI